MDQWNKSVCKSLRHVNSKWFFLLLRGPTFRNCPTIPWVCFLSTAMSFSQKCPLLSYSKFTSSRGLLRWKSRLTHTFRNIWHVTCDMTHGKHRWFLHQKVCFIIFHCFPPGWLDPLENFFASWNQATRWIQRTKGSDEHGASPRPAGGFSLPRVPVPTSMSEPWYLSCFKPWHKNPKLSRLTTVLGWILVFWQIIQHWSKFQQLKTQFSGSSLVISLGYNAVIPKHNSLKGLKDEYLVGRIPF